MQTLGLEQQGVGFALPAALDADAGECASAHECAHACVRDTRERCQPSAVSPWGQWSELAGQRLGRRGQVGVLAGDPLCWEHYLPALVLGFLNIQNITYSFTKSYTQKAFITKSLIQQTSSHPLSDLSAVAIMVLYSKKLAAASVILSVNFKFIVYSVKSVYRTMLACKFFYNGK